MRSSKKFFYVGLVGAILFGFVSIFNHYNISLPNIFNSSNMSTVASESTNEDSSSSNYSIDTSDDAYVSSDSDKVSDKETITLLKTIDGDTAKFNTPTYGEVNIRFSGINTPESTNTIEEYGKEASNFTKEQLENASIIEVEWDLTQSPSHKRPIGIIYVDGVNLNLLIVQEGWGDLKYLKDSMPYENEYERALNEAQAEHKGRWE